MSGVPVRRGILALDIEGFGRPSRTDPQRSRLRARLHGLLDRALARAQLLPTQVAARGDLGDGILVLFDPAVSAATLLHPLVADLTAQLATQNQTVAEPERIRLRIAIHEGQVLTDAHGHTGEDLNHTFRLLDAHATRTVLASSPSADAVLAVTDTIFHGVIQHRYPGLDPDKWQPIRVHTKETRTRAWVHLPGLARQPDLPAVLAAPCLGPASLPIPHELPGPISQFTGRGSELVHLGRMLDVAAGTAGMPVVISAIDGMGGIGKSALAIQAAHQLAGRFPDGQLYVNLHGATPGHPSCNAMAALGRMLRSLGMDPAAIPAEIEEASARWRSLAADRRLLIVLDNARSPEQVRPLLPASPTCAVLITSRQVLATLDGARPLHLDLLAPEQALDLLAKLAGGERVAAEPQAAAEVTRLCGLLPLAIRLAGARLCVRPAWPVSELARRLADATRRLDELTMSGVGVRAAFDVSLETLQHSTDPIDHAAAAAFGLLSLPDAPDLDVPAAGRLLDQPQSTAQTLLERLVDAQLLETPRPGRYQFHDLVRLYGRQDAISKHPEPGRLAALERLFGYYTATAWHTFRLLRPGDQRLAAADQRWSSGGLQLPDAAAAVDWLEAERPNLLAAIGQIATIAPAIPAKLATQLSSALFSFLEVGGYWTDWLQANQTALALACRTGNRAGQAQAHNDLGVVYGRMGRYQESISHHRQALTIRRKISDHWGQAASLDNLSLIYGRLQRYEESIDLAQQALTIFRAVGDRHGEAYCLAGLGAAFTRLGRYQEAIDYLQQSLAIEWELGDRWGSAVGLGDLGVAYMRLGRYPQALDHQQQALTLFRALNYRWGQPLSLNNLGRIYLQLGRYQEAIDHQQRALALFREVGDRHGEAEVLRDLGDALLAAGRPQKARKTWREALELCEALQVPEADEVRRRLANSPGDPPASEVSSAPETDGAASD